MRPLPCNLPSPEKASAYFASRAFPIASCPLPLLLAHCMDLLGGPEITATQAAVLKRAGRALASAGEAAGIKDFNWRSYGVLLRAAKDQNDALRRGSLKFLQMLSHFAAFGRMRFVKLNSKEEIGQVSGFLRLTLLYRILNGVYLEIVGGKLGDTSSVVEIMAKNVRRIALYADSICQGAIDDWFFYRAWKMQDEKCSRNCVHRIFTIANERFGLRLMDPVRREPLLPPAFPAGGECAAYFKGRSHDAGPPRLDMLCSLLFAELEAQGESKSTIGQYRKCCGRLCCLSDRLGESRFSAAVLEKYVALEEELAGKGIHRGWKLKLARSTAVRLRHLASSGTLAGFGIKHFWDRKEIPWLNALLLRYQEHLEQSGLKPATVYQRKRVFRIMAEAAGAKGEEDLLRLGHADAARIEARFSSLGSASSLKTYVGILKGIFSWLYGQGIVEADLSGLFLPPYIVRDWLAPYLTLEDQDKLRKHVRDHCTLRDQAIILLALDQGLRASDIIKLKRSEIDFRRRQLRLVQKKTGVPAVLPLAAGPAAALKAYIEHGRPQKPRGRGEFVFLRSRAPFRRMSNLYAVFQKAMRGAGVVPRNKPAAGPHLCRYSFAHSLLCVPTPHKIITSSLGHASPGSDRPYFALDPQKLVLCCLGLSSLGIGHAPLAGKAGGGHG